MLYHLGMGNQPNSGRSSAIRQQVMRFGIPQYVVGLIQGFGFSFGFFGAVRIFVRIPFFALCQKSLLYGLSVSLYLRFALRLC